MPMIGDQHAEQHHQADRRVRRGDARQERRDGRRDHDAGDRAFDRLLRADAGRQRPPAHRASAVILRRIAGDDHQERHQQRHRPAIGVQRRGQAERHGEIQQREQRDRGEAHGVLVGPAAADRGGRAHQQRRREHQRERHAGPDADVGGQRRHAADRPGEALAAEPGHPRVLVERQRDDDPDQDRGVDGRQEPGDAEDRRQQDERGEDARHGRLPTSALRLSPAWSLSPVDPTPP